MRDIIMATKTKYARMIYLGEKKYEIRKVLPYMLRRESIFREVSEGRIYLYESSPVQMVTGYIYPAPIIAGSARWLFEKYGQYFGISLIEYQKYLRIGEDEEDDVFLRIIKILKAVKFDKPIKLNCRPPQNFMYLREGMLKEEV